MDFVVDNYFWFIVGGVIILMIVIGYIAEKTDFGRRPFKEKKEKDNVDVSISTGAEEIAVGEKTESGETIFETDTNQFMVQNEIETPEIISDEFAEAEKAPEANIADIIIEEPANEEVVEETTTNLDIPEISVVDNPVSNIPEEVVEENSGDDVWKF